MQAGIVVQTTSEHTSRHVPATTPAPARQTASTPTPPTLRRRRKCRREPWSHRSSPLGLESQGVLICQVQQSPVSHIQLDTDDINLHMESY